LSLVNPQTKISGFRIQDSGFRIQDSGFRGSGNFKADYDSLVGSVEEALQRR